MSLFDTPKRIAVALGTLLVIALTWGAGNAFAQDETTLSVETERAQSGEAVDVPVQVTDFNGVGSISLTINYDSEVVSFPGGDVSTGDLISGEPRGSFQASRPEPGELRISFFDQTGTDPINLGDGTLFNITFSSFAGGSGEVTIDEENSEIGNAQAETIPVTFRNGAVVDQDAGTVSVGTVEGAALNETVSVPLSGENLQDVGSASLEIGFDASALQFEGVANDQSGLDLQGSANDGTVRIAGQSVEGGSLGDSFVEVEFSFLGGSPALDFLVSSEVTDPQGNVLPAEFADGSVAGDVPVVSFPDRGVGAGETISVPVQAEDLREVGAVTLETTYDPSVLTFEGSEEGFGALSVSNPSDGIVRISGQSSSGIDPSSNGDKFINLRFSVGQDLSLGTESVLGFNAEESELASIDAEPYNTAFESGLVRVEDTEIAVSADSVSYDVTAIDSTSGRVVTVTNESDSIATLEGEISGPEAPFSIASGGGPFTLEPGESQDVTVNYSPVEVSNPDRDTLSISHNADNEESPFEVPLAGQAEAPSIAASVAPDTAAVRSGQELALTQTVANEATDAAVLEVEVTGVPDFLTLEGASVTSGDGTVDGQALTLQPGAEAELEYSFQESVDTTTVFGGAIVHQTNDPDAASPLELPVEITAEAVQVALNAQSLDLTAGDTELRVEDVIANQGDTVVITTDDGDGDFSDEEIAGSTPVEEDLDGEDVLVDVEGASPVDHAAHVSTDGTVSGVVATSDRAPVYATAQFEFNDETAVGETGTVTVDAVEILYEGEVGTNQIAINLHEANQESGRVGAFVGISQEDLAVNEVHEDVAVDVVEPVSPDEENPERIEDTIEETGDFFAMAHRGAAGTDADGERIPAQNPPLATTAGPGVIGDFATVTVERERGVALNPQSLDLTAGDTDLRIEDVIANPGDAVVVTTDDGDGEFGDEDVVGTASVEDSLNSENVLVDVEGADPVDHAAHVSTDGTVSGVVATSDRAPVYATAQFDFSDETSVGPAETVTVDSVRVLYNGAVGRDTISINLHEASGGEITGDFIGISQEDLAVNETHEEVAVDVIEPISPPAESPQRTESTIAETGEFFAMAHLGPAGTGADGGRVPVGGSQQPPLRTTASPGVIGDFATVTVERERGVALNPQSLDLTAGDTELRIDSVIANAGDAVVVTTDDGDGDFTDEEVVGSTTVEENVNGGEVLVDVEGADPVDHAAHVSTDGTVSGVVATSDRAPVYATAQFDWQDENSVGPAETVSVDAVEILYQGEVGRDTISVNLHEASGGEITGDFIGISQEDLAVNVVHEEVAIDVIEPISPPAESPQRTESTIAETGEFFAMAHLGPAGTGADGGRVPVGGAQQPPLRTTASPGVIGDFATVTVEAADLNVSVSRGFEGGASDPADYELVAIPGSTGVDVAETVTGDRGTNWRAFLETGGSGGDGSLQSYGDEAFGFRAGRGVWVLAQNGWSFEGTVPAVSAADGTPSVPLQDGWNAISNPLQEDLVWANVRDASGLSEALFRWTGEGGFQPVDTLRSAQESGEAYYTLNNEGADSLELTSSAGPNSTLAANTAAESRSNASPRTVELSAAAGGKGMTSTVTVGMNPSAEEASSYRAPPAHFGGTALRIRDGDPVKSFMRMVAATDAETSRFDLSLQAEPGTSVEISAGDLPKNAGPGFGVVLVDGGDTYDLRDGPATVTVGENSGSAGFQVRLGDAEKIAQQTAPDKTRLRANYPNPFSEQTTIEYDLAEQSEVNIRVYNVLGQQVATLAQGTKQAGTYKIDWSGQNLSSGKYFVRLEAGGTADTKQVTVVR